MCVSMVCDLTLSLATLPKLAPRFQSQMMVGVYA